MIALRLGRERVLRRIDACGGTTVNVVAIQGNDGPLRRYKSDCGIPKGVLAKSVFVREW